MGMDIYGRNPSAEEGEYFHVTVWRWAALHSLIIDLCSDFLDEDLLKAMAYSDGEGPKDQATCDRMAERINNWMEHNASGKIVDRDQLPRGSVTLEPLGLNDPKGILSYDVTDVQLKTWLAFLLHCGGFTID